MKWWDIYLKYTTFAANFISLCPYESIYRIRP